MNFAHALLASIVAGGIPMIVANATFASGCTAGADNSVTVELASKFQLRVGQTAKVATENVEIAFLSVSSDSRCGKGEVCIWEGDALIRLRLQSAGGASVERELHTASKEINAVDYGAYSVRLLALFPSAMSGKTIAPSDYVATLTFVRGSSEDGAIY